MIVAIEKQSMLALINPGNPIASDNSYQIESGVAIIEVIGAITKCDSVFTTYQNCTSTGDIRTKLADAINDAEVKQILFYICSPGGTTDGLTNLVDDIRNCPKPTTAYIDDIGASAAYWIASQCNQIIANRSGWIGSIGVYQIILDSSKQAENEGVKVLVITNDAGAEFKGQGVPGTVITDDATNDIKRRVNSIASIFINDIALGRNKTVDEITKYATGQIFIAPDALAMGLIDSIDSLENCLGGLINAN